MKILLVNGSPHQDGTTARALKEVEKIILQAGFETEWFHLGTAPIRGCIACRACSKLDHCAFDDDPCNTLIEMAKEADGFVFGSPVYYASINGAFGAVLDRAFYSASEYFRFKPAAGVVCCRRGGDASAFDRLNKYFTINQMPVVSSQYWNDVHGHNALQAEGDEEGMQTMRTLGRNLVWLVESIAKAGLDKPAKEKRIATNFIR